MIDIKCEKGICPICGNKVKRRSSLRLVTLGSKYLAISCENGCYSIREDHNYFHSGHHAVYRTYSVFDKTFLIEDTNSRKKKKQLKKDLIKAIEYYRTDYRYVAEILSK